MDKRTCLVLLCAALCVAARSTSTVAAGNQFSASPAPSSFPKARPVADRRDTRSQPWIIEQFSHRNPDGSYEFRYELSDGNTRYERGYFDRFNDGLSLVVTGYYGYRMDDGRYTTVFYTADRGGYRQKAATSSQKWQNLPRTIDVTTAGAGGGALALARRFEGEANGI